MAVYDLKSVSKDRGAYYMYPSAEMAEWWDVWLMNCIGLCVGW